MDATVSSPPYPWALCTIVDRQYLPRVLTLYRSLDAAGEDFRLFVYGAEAGVVGTLDRLDLPRLTTVDTTELERDDLELAATRADRSLSEYCYTAKPCISLHALRAHPEIDRITYIDADLICLASLQPLLDEIESGSVALSPHRFSARWRHAESTHGAFNAGFVSFRRDDSGVGALAWWRERCLEWCYLRVEPGRYTDQVYLEQMPKLFPDVHVIAHTGVNQGPWNAEGRHWSGEGRTVRADGTPILLFHFASLQMLTGRAAATAAIVGDRFGRVVPAARQFTRLKSNAAVVWKPFPGFRLSRSEVELLWSPYAERLMDSTIELERHVREADFGVCERRWPEVSADILRGSAPTWTRRAARVVRLRRSA